MKACLDDKELLRLWVAESEDYPDRRGHMAQCPRCLAAYERLTREAGTIVSAVTSAADRLSSGDHAVVRGIHAHTRERAGMAAIFGGAMAFGGAAAFGLLLTLGWHPGSTSVEVANTASGEPAASVATEVAALDEAAGSYRTGSIRAADLLTNDPVADLVYGDAVQSANSGAGDDDLFFCVPGDDSAICSSSADRG